MGEVAGGEGGHLLDLVVVASDGVDELGEGAHDAARHEGLERDVEVAGRDVLLEVVGEEQHRPAEGRVLEHDRGVVGDEQVDREQQVVHVDRRTEPVEQTIAERFRDAEVGPCERVHPDDDHRVLLDGERVERRIVEHLERILTVPWWSASR